MMKQKKHKMGKKILFLLLLTAITINISNVFADDSKTYVEETNKTTCKEDFPDSEAKQKECLETATKCFEKLNTSTFILKVKANDKNQYIITLSSNADSKTTFTIKYTIVQPGKENKTEQFDIEVAKKGKYTSDPISANSNTEIKVTALLTSELTASVAMKNKTENINCARRYTGFAEADMPDTTSSVFDNPDYYTNPGGICYKYMNNQLTENEIGSKYKELLDKYKYTNIAGIDTYFGSGAEMFEQNAAYCFNDKITSKMTKGQLIKTIYKAAKSIEKSKREGEKSNGKDPIPADAIPVDDVTKAINLTCDAFGSVDNSKGIYTSENNTRIFYHELEEIKKEVNYNYRTDQKTPVTVCTVDCQEILTITYGPPVAVKAGFCFEYEVKVESKVSCDSTYNKNAAPKQSKYQICTPVPYCNRDGAAYENQAGPNDEFDECIVKRDGGKYTQKAINYCYNKVYGKKSNNKQKMDLALNYSNVERMNATIDECGMTNGKYNIYGEGNGTNVYTAYTTKGYYAGYYSNSGKKWNAYGDKTPIDSDGNEIPILNGCHWNLYARYYFGTLTRSQRTVGNDGDSANRFNKEFNDDLTKWWYHPKYGFKVGYIADSIECSDSCSFYTKDGTYYNEYDTSNCTGKYYNFVAPGYAVKNACDNNKNGDDCKRISALDQYYKDYEAYESALESCNAAAKCDTKTATYKMTINNLAKTSKVCEIGETGDDCSSWTETNKAKNQCEYNTKNPTKNGVTSPATNSGLTGLLTPDAIKQKCKNLNNGSSIIREISGVCANIPGDNQWYRTVIAFPGSWRYTKNYTYVYEDPKNKNDYIFKPGQYCVGTTIKEVNKEWWEWDQESGRSITEASKLNTKQEEVAGKTITILNGGKYNIKALIQTFGQAGWNFNVKCFYGAKKEGPPDTDVSPTNYETKAAALDDLFPATENTTSGSSGNSSAGEMSNELKEAKVEKLINTVETTGDNNVLKLGNTTASRTTGYNWSCEASNILIKNYPITPVALIAKIQDKGDSVYNDEKELDYSFTLSPAQIKKIRENNKKRGDDPYTITGNSTWENSNNDIKFYRSKLLSKKTYVTVHVRPSEKSVLCNNMINNKEKGNAKCDTYSNFVNQSSCAKEKQ